MFDAIRDLLPAEWRGGYEVLSAPLRWIPEWQDTLLRQITGGSMAEAVALGILLLPPALLLIAGMWSTMASLYTLPFRSGRGTFVTAIVMAWWDAGRCAWLYWGGFVRVAFAIVGYVWGLARFSVRFVGKLIKGLFNSPLQLLDWTSRRYFQPGMPWLAFLLLLLWCAVEGTIFTFTLRPTLTEVLAGITGYEPDPRAVTPLLFIFLFLLITGSFACVQVLTEAVRSRQWSNIIQMTFVETTVMFFEVVFLYRELIDAVAPWVAQTTGGQVRLGLVSTILLASFGWVGVRGMTWFLFGRFGTPAVLAILSRQTLTHESPVSTPAPVQPDLWREPINALKGETEWFRAESKRFFELLSLPVLQLLAASVNFIVVAVQSRPAFVLPFRQLEDLLAAAPFVRREREEKGSRKRGGVAMPAGGSPIGRSLTPNRPVQAVNQ